MDIQIMNLISQPNPPNTIWNLPQHNSWSNPEPAQFVLSILTSQIVHPYFLLRFKMAFSSGLAGSIHCVAVLHRLVRDGPMRVWVWWRWWHSWNVEDVVNELQKSVVKNAIFIPIHTRKLSMKFPRTYNVPLEFYLEFPLSLFLTHTHHAAVHRVVLFPLS